MGLINQEEETILFLQEGKRVLIILYHKSKRYQDNSKKGNRVGDDVKLGYKLVFTKDNLESKDISEFDFKNFKLEHPQIAEILLNPEKLTSDQELMEKIQLDNWQTTALHIMSTLWKIKNANVFHAPVNPVKLGRFKTNTRYS